MLADDSFRKPKAKAGPTLAFRSVERLEDAGQIASRDSTSVVGDNHADPLAMIGRPLTTTEDTQA
jgi:hypothetical protein